MSRFSAEELRRAKDHLKGATLLALEGSGQRMNSLASYHVYFKRYFSPSELIALLEKVTPGRRAATRARILPARAAWPPASSATSTASS